MQFPDYQVLIDWDADGGLLVGDFEHGVDRWDPQGFISAPPVRAQSTVRAYHGDASLLVTWSAWASGSIQLVQPDPMATFVVGRSYTMSARVWVPSSGGAHVLCAVAALGFGSASTLTDQWQEITLTFTATATTHLLQIWVSGTPAGGEQTWLDFVRLYTADENVGPGGQQRIPWGSALSIDYGRDQARSLAPMASGRLTGLELDNSSREYSPLNASSPLFGLLEPGREVAVTATYSGRVYSLYRGYLDDFSISPDLDTRRVSFTAVDAMGRLQGLSVSTAVYPALRTGDAIHRLLDAIGWSRGRDIDPGASTVRWWYADSDDALAELEDLVAAEGPTARVHVGPSGEFVFRDRHHQLVRAASTTVQATIRDTGAEPHHDPPLVLDLAWRDVINAVSCRVQEREPAAQYEAVWSDTSIFTLAPGESRRFVVTFEDPVYGAIPPTWGTADPDIVTTTASQVTSELSRTSGRSLTLTLRTSPSASTVVVTRVRLRALAVRVVRTLTVSAQDPESIRRHGRRSTSVESTWLNRHDAAAVLDLILGHRAQRRPVVSFAIVNSSSTALAQQLGRDLSDRVHVVDAESGIDHDAIIETIGHRIGDGGKRHVTVFACETVATPPSNMFRFDAAGAGFNDGVFAPSGFDDPTTVFRFDVAGQGFNQGLFAT